jgi:hypothetical protein
MGSAISGENSSVPRLTDVNDMDWHPTQNSEGPLFSTGKTLALSVIINVRVDSYSAGFTGTRWYSLEIVDKTGEVY